MAGKVKRKRTKKNESNPRILGLLILCLVIGMGELLFFTWVRVQFVRVKYEISNETSKTQKMLTIQKNLKIELAHLKSPKRIAEIARTKLGLVMPDSEQMVKIQ